MSAPLRAPFPWFGGKRYAERERIWFSPHCLNQELEFQGRQMTLEEATP